MTDNARPKTAGEGLRRERERSKAYDEAFRAAVKTRWNDLIRARRDTAASHKGKVVLQFRLHSDGRITDMWVIENTSGEVMGVLCQKAVLDPAPYERWPREVLQWVGAASRVIKLTFYYGDDIQALRP